MLKFNYEGSTKILKALGHPVRLCILKNLIDHERCNVSYMKERISISQSGISQHLSKLKKAGIVQGCRKGNEIYYEIIDENARQIAMIVFLNAKE